MIAPSTNFDLSVMQPTKAPVIVKNQYPFLMHPNKNNRLHNSQQNSNRRNRLNNSQHNRQHNNLQSNKNNNLYKLKTQLNSKKWQLVWLVF